MSFVLDSSVTLAWAFPDERTPETQALYKEAARQTIFTSAIWTYEVANTLDRAERRGRVSPSELAHAYGSLALLDIRIVPPARANELESVVTLARLHKLTSYDASFLRIAQLRALPLATLDSDLARAAERAGVPLLL